MNMHMTMTLQEMAIETTSVYDNYVEVLETGSVHRAKVKVIDITGAPKVDAAVANMLGYPVTREGSAASS